MNIFVLDLDIDKCAQYHCDKHVVKMILESTQLLFNVYHYNNYSFNNFLEDRKIYRKTHINHPCSVWTRTSLSNWKWLLSLALSLCKEYSLRYSKEHKSEKILKWMQNNEPNINDTGLTDFAKAMPEKYKSFDIVNAYRQYYIFEKSKISKWKNNNIPDWFIKT